MSPKQGMREKRREQLTRAAMACIVRKGYDHVTLEDVSREVGMSRGIASYYFNSKEDLLVSVLQMLSQIYQLIWIIFLSMAVCFSYQQPQ